MRMFFVLFVCFVVLFFIRKLKYGERLVSLDDTAYYESLCQLKGMGARSLWSGDVQHQSFAGKKSLKQQMNWILF